MQPSQLSLTNELRDDVSLTDSSLGAFAAGLRDFLDELAQPDSRTEMCSNDSDDLRGLADQLRGLFEGIEVHRQIEVAIGVLMDLPGCPYVEASPTLPMLSTNTVSAQAISRLP